MFGCKAYDSLPYRASLLMKRAVNMRIFCQGSRLLLYPIKRSRPRIIRMDLATASSISMASPRVPTHGGVGSNTFRTSSGAVNARARLMAATAALSAVTDPIRSEQNTSDFSRMVEHSPGVRSVPGSAVVQNTVRSTSEEQSGKASQPPIPYDDQIRRLLFRCFYDAAYRMVYLL